MRLIRRSTLFKRGEIELSEEEYKVYKLRRYYGIIDGMICGIALSIAVMWLSKIL